MMRRRSLPGLSAALLATPALAQQPWPNRPVRIVVPFAPGGSTDVSTRLLAPRMQQNLGQPVQIDFGATDE